MSTAEAVTLSRPCAHAEQVRIRTVQRPAAGCADCLDMGGQWLHLRTCLVCGRVGCCDSSPNQHASKHFRDTGHAIMTSAEPGESWVWCFVDEQEL